ncbi:unnamed protein product [Ectocarpus sp. 12 AP-2014]
MIRWKHFFPTKLPWHASTTAREKSGLDREKPRIASPQATTNLCSHSQFELFWPYLEVRHMESTRPTPDIETDYPSVAKLTQSDLLMLQENERSEVALQVVFHPGDPYICSRPWGRWIPTG